jgi:hypothetical protein
MDVDSRPERGPMAPPALQLRWSPSSSPYLANVRVAGQLDRIDTECYGVKRDLWRSFDTWTWVRRKVRTLTIYLQS